MDNSNPCVSHIPAYELPRCAVMLVLDTSHSMYRGTALKDLAQSVRSFCGVLSREAFAGSAVDIAAVSMGDNLGLLAPFAPLASSPLRNFSVRPKGDTPIGGALRIALKAIDARIARWHAEGRLTVTSQLVVLSDGVSTDDFSAEAAEIRSRVARGELAVRAIALGANADRTSLAKIAGGEILDPFGMDMAGAFDFAGMEVSHGYEHEAAASAIRRSAAPQPVQGGRSYLIDGTNLIFWDVKRSGLHLAYVLALARFLKERGEKYRVFFDASTPYRLREKGAPDDEACYRQALKARPDIFVEIPGGQQADAYLLMQAARDASAVVISNDRFRDREHLYPWVRDPARHVGGMMLDGALCFPDLGWHVPIGQGADSASRRVDSRSHPYANRMPNRM